MNIRKKAPWNCKKSFVAFACGLVLWACAAAAQAQSLAAQSAGNVEHPMTTVRVEAPVLDAETADSAALLARLVEDSTREAQARVGAAYALSYGSKLDSAALRVSCFANGHDPIRISFVAAPARGEAASVAASYALRDEMDALRALPALIAGLVISVGEGGRSDARSAGAAVVAELATEPFAPLFGLDAPLKPYVYDVAPTTEEGICAGLLGGLASFDSLFRIAEIRRPEGEASWFAAIKAASTPSGTFFAADSQGNLWRFRPNAAAEKIRSSSGAPLRLAAFPDGSLLLSETGAASAVRVEGRRRSEFHVAGAALQPWIPFSIDGEGRAWTYEYESGLVRICLEDGSLVDAIKPVLPAGSAPTAILPLAGGDFVLLSRNSLSGHDRSGRARWTLPSILPTIDPLGSPALPIAAAVDAKDGSIWLAESIPGRIWRLVDLDYARSKGGPDQATARLLELDAAVAAAPENRAAYEARAAFLEATGAFELAHAARLVMTSTFPDDTANKAKADAYGAAMEKTALMRRARAVYGPLERLGPESARAEYMAALKAFERYLAEHPDDGEAKAERDRLVRIFSEKEKPTPPPAGPAPRIAQAEAEELFPALLAAYRERPIGRCVVEYQGASPASSLLLRASLKDFSDFPTETRRAGPIAPGSRLELPIFIQLNRSVLELQEDLPVQLKIEAIFSADSGEAKVERTLTLLVHRRSALVWTEIGALASFITPNEESVSSFAIAAAANAPRLPWSRLVAKAAAVTRALGSLGMAYVEDPRSPFPSASGGAVADTVRFPRTTLAARAGDCDDTSALLASCLEAVGIRTAIIGVPGHILVAFAAEEKERDAWLFQGESLGPILRGGEVWIPLESTVLSEGFMACWREGYRVWNAAEQASKAEFQPLAAARSSFPPLPLTAAADPPPLASMTRASALAIADAAAIEERFLAPLTGRLLSGSHPDTNVSTVDLNRAGVLAARLGDRTDAETLLALASKRNPSWIAPRVNLYNARLLAGDGEGAGKALEVALAAEPNSPILVGLYASWLESRGRTLEAQRFVEAMGAKGISPRTVIIAGENRLADAEGDTARGADTGSPLLAEWEY